MKSPNEEKRCKNHFNLSERNGKNNLIKAFQEQTLLRNIKDQVSVAEKFADKRNEIYCNS